MSEFIPSHTPRHASAFLTGYLTAAEWTLDDETVSRKIRGWSAAALRKAARDCHAFTKLQAEALAEYVAIRADECAARGYSAEECAGHDFWLTRNGHGVGFADRGNAPCFAALDAFASRCAPLDVYRSDSGWLHFS